MSLIGREVSSFASMGGHREESVWAGKPWRRVELVTRRYFWKGDQHTVERDLTFHLGSRKLGLFATVVLARQRGYDYSEERL